MADYSINAVTRRVVYTGSAGVGPYAFNFEILTQTDIVVYKDTTKLTLTTDYTVTINANGTGSVTLVVAATSGNRITILGQRAVSRTTDFVTAGDLLASALNDQLDSQIIMIQQLAEENKRTMKAPQYDPASIDDGGTVSMVLPVAASRANKVLAFDANGNPIASTSPLSTIEGSALAAASSATAAATSATNAASSASAASSSATSASTSAMAASSSAAAAAASAASGLYRQVLDKSANYTVTSADAGSLLRASTGSGAVTFTLPQISTLYDGFKIAVVKWTSDANTVVVARSGSDTINGSTSSSVGAQYSQIVLVADFETNTWFASQSGLGATNMNIDVFSGNGSTTAFTLTSAPGAAANAHVYVGGIYQYHSTFTIVGTTLTFSSAPPIGTGNIEVWYGTPLAIGTPSDGTVTDAKLTSTGVTAGTYGSATAVAQVTVNAQGRVTAAQEITISGVPTGSLTAFAGSAAPTGWLLCYGQAVSRTTYAALFAIISTTYGVGDGSTTFNLPDLRGRAPHGVDNMGGTAANRVTSGGSGITGTTLGAVGGTETHTLTIAQMPAHTHPSGVFNGGGCIGSGGTSSPPTGQITTGSTGGGGAHQNMSPTIMLNYIIKT